jgi:hypothetical protein
MNVTCRDRERIFEDGTPAEWAALETHAAGCVACAEEVRAWKALSAAAKELQDYSPNLELWTCIERALVEEDARKAHRSARKKWFSFWPAISAGWQTALAGTLVLILTVSLSWIVIRRPFGRGTRPPDASLLKSAALEEVEKSEREYEKAIDKLAAEAKPQLDDPATPLMANYHEKLLVLDSAIDDLRALAGLNPSNAQLRHQLLAMYREKQETLEEVLEARK